MLVKFWSREKFKILVRNANDPIYYHGIIIMIPFLAIVLYTEVLKKPVTTNY